MQVMPATARWTARQLGLPYSPGALKDLDFNLRIGMAYWRRVLDDFGGALPLAAAAYNAGPGRPRRWREGAHCSTPPPGPRRFPSPKPATM
jgi:soluble lytic murein transglycosylase